MNWGGPEFVIAIIAISTVGWLASTWIRARHGYPIENEWCGMTSKDDQPESKRKVQLLTQENERLTGQIARLEDRIATLERIATDPARRVSDEIEQLR